MPQSVYPRVCGLILSSEGLGGRDPGLPPRVRAYPNAILCGCGQKKVYPRVCGLIELKNSTAAHSTGLPPRVRAYRLFSTQITHTGRSTPACAGLSLAA